MESNHVKKKFSAKLPSLFDVIPIVNYCCSLLYLWNTDKKDPIFAKKGLFSRKLRALPPLQVTSNDEPKKAARYR